jgi:hypothetical protein
MPDVYFENAATGKRFKVVGRDTEKGTVRLRGEMGEFDEPYSKERFEQLGYTLVQGESA